MDKERVQASFRKSGDGHRMDFRLMEKGIFGCAVLFKEGEL